MTDFPKTLIALTRDVAVMQIPSGERVVLPSKSLIRITQSLGGNYTVEVPSIGGLYRIDGKDSDALGLSPATGAGAGAPAAGGEGALTENLVYDALKTVYDPEIPVNVVELGLIYDLTLKPLEGGGNRVEVKMTLTAPGCGMGSAIAADARSKIIELPGVKEADVELVWEPVWNPSMMSEAAKLTLGLM
jgi:probable FeS assembly SUF system protein SufT